MEDSKEGVCRRHRDCTRRRGRWFCQVCWTTWSGVSDCCVVDWYEFALSDRRAKWPSCSLEEAKRPVHENVLGKAWASSETTFLAAKGRTRGNIFEKWRNCSMIKFCWNGCSIDRMIVLCICYSEFTGIIWWFGYSSGSQWGCSKYGNCNGEIVAPWNEADSARCKQCCIDEKEMPAK